MDFTFTPDEERFRLELRQWLQDNLPRGWGAPGYEYPKTYEDWARVRRQWDRTLHAGGYAGLSWPREYGGRGATLIEQVIYFEEIARARAPEELNRGAKLLLGPTIIRHGTEAQKQRFLPRILSGDDIWCQGFSEPNAGSDLASISTRAVRDGDMLVVNGQKVWTSYATVADWIFMLVRTDPEAPKHQGITFLLADVRTPGITVRPIVQMTGSREFAETFFDNVRVPIANVLGAVNEGWPVTATALSHERGTLAFHRHAMIRVELDELIDVARRVRRGGQPVSEEPLIRQRLAQCASELDMLRWTLYRNLTRQIQGGPAGAEGSIVKLYWSELYQRITELALEILGPASQIAGGARAEEGGRWQFRFLKSRGDSIHSGTNQIQRNIIAERLLGLPR
ncbi:MAG: acyl-CoA dehydrogenase family protein [Candidatus Rokubacteria bacterium]|nr:acyl-CoA dehydrogenase family protein [Candidatus Rokubacteria bacterium]